MDRRGRAFWETVVAELERRGASQAEVAREHGVKLATLRWWVSQLRREAGRRRGRPPVRILPVEITPAPRVLSPIEVRVVTGDVVVVEPGTDASYVAQLVAALRGTSC